MRSEVRSFGEDGVVLPTSEDREASEAIGVAALRGALASLVGGVVLEAVWGATARALHGSAATDSASGSERPEEERGVPCPPGAGLPTPCDPRGMAAWGAAYGALHHRVRAPTIVHGLILGVLMHAASGAGIGIVPRAAGNGATPRREGDGAPVIAHVAYGLATAATYEALS